MCLFKLCAFNAADVAVLGRTTRFSPPVSTSQVWSQLPCRYSLVHQSVVFGWLSVTGHDRHDIARATNMSEYPHSQSETVSFFATVCAVVVAGASLCIG